MPGFGLDHDEPGYYRALAKAREKISCELEAKGMVRGHGKFDDVVRRKLHKRRYWN